MSGEAEVDPLGTWQMCVSESVQITGEDIINSIQLASSNLSDTPHFDKVQSFYELEKIPIKQELSQSIRTSLDQQWSLQQKFDNSKTSGVFVKPFVEEKKNQTEDDAKLNQQEDHLKDEMIMSLKAPEVFHPTQKRVIPEKKTKVNKQYVVQFKEVNQTGNSKKRSLEENERTFQVSEEKDIQIGASSRDCDYIISDGMNSISRKHAVMRFDDEKDIWSLVDEGSTNGTFIIKKDLVLEAEMTLIVGSFLCEVRNIQKIDEQTKRLGLFFSNLIEESINSFFFQIDIKLGDEPINIGKKYQKELKEDLFVEDTHCSIKMAPNKEIHLINISDIYHQVGIKLTSQVPYKLKKESIIQFGLLKKYELSIKSSNKVVTTFSDQNGTSQASSEEDNCLSCTQSQQRMYILQPCNHKYLCLECITIKNIQICPTCNLPFSDFI